VGGGAYQALSYLAWYHCSLLLGRVSFWYDVALVGAFCSYGDLFYSKVDPGRVIFMESNNKGTYIVLAFAVIAGLLYGAWRLMSYSITQDLGGSDEDMVFCTQEALQCPDGSYVGRSGAQCAFAPCPDQTSFTGTLQQSADGFALIIASPENGGVGEVAYRMPLVLKVSNVLGQLVGRKVRVYGSFTEGATLAVDHLEELKGDAGDPTLGEVGVGKAVFINGVRVTLDKIVQDSRCPVDVQCIQAGWVTARVTLQSTTDKETRDMRSDAGDVAFDSYQVSIESVQPVPISSATPDPTSYLVTFRVRANQ